MKGLLNDHPRSHGDPAVEVFDVVVEHSDATIGNEMADRVWLVRAMNSIFPASKRHGGYAHRITRRAAWDHLRQVGFVMPHLRRW